MDDRRSQPSLVRRIWPFAKWGLFAVVMWYVARRGWEVWRDTPSGALHVDWVWLIPAFIAYAFGGWSSVWFWRETLRGFGSLPAFMELVRAYYIGNLGKYVPGKAMVLIIRAALLRRSGITPGVAAITATYETLATMGAGAAIAVALSPQATSPRLWNALPGWLQAFRDETLLLPVIVAIATLASLPVIARLVNQIARKMLPKAEAVAPAAGISTGTLLKGLVVLSVGWCVFAISLGCVLRALGAPSDPATGFPVWLAGVTLSTVSGFVILIAPGGLGVREMLLVEVLQSQPGITPAQAFIAAWLLRATWLCGELLISAALWWWPRRGAEGRG